MSNQIEHKQMHYLYNWFTEAKKEEESNYMKEYKGGVEIDLEDE